MKRHVLILRYSGFAALATIANLAAQRGVLHLANGRLEASVGFISAMVVGTGAGLVLKYILDKRWIFYDPSSGLANHSRKFALYTVMGIATTVIFWASETGFWLIWHSQPMRELGAVLGLTVGYITKYNLDRRFVFGRPAGAGQT